MSRKFDLERYLETYFDDIKSSGDERIVTCFYCGKRQKLYINIVKQKFHCFRCGAGVKASIYDLIRDHLGLSESQVYDLIRSGKFASYRSRSYAALFERRHIERRSRVLPDEYVPLYPLDLNNLNPFVERAVGYVRSRGLTDADSVLYRLGYCLDGKYARRIIVPVALDGEDVYFVARLFFGSGKRYLNPASSEVTLNPGSLVFNWDQGRVAKTLRITEGVFDAMALGDDVVAILGNQLRDAQLRLLESGKFEAIEVWLDSIAKDPDSDRKAYALTEQLYRFDRPISVAHLAYGDPALLRTRDIPVDFDRNVSLRTILARRFRGEGRRASGTTSR